METIHQLLSRIRWDDEFGKGEFSVGIYDRFADAVEFQPLERLHMEKGNHFSFTIILDGEVLTIPFHRIREVRRTVKPSGNGRRDSALRLSMLNVAPGAAFASTNAPSTIWPPFALPPQANPAPRVDASSCAESVMVTHLVCLNR